MADARRRPGSLARCGGCGAPLRDRRRDALWCSEACRKRSCRLGAALGLTETELGFPPGEYPERSARLWEGMAQITERGHLRRAEARAPGRRGMGRGRPAQAVRRPRRPDKGRTPHHPPKEEQ